MWKKWICWKSKILLWPELSKGLSNALGFRLHFNVNDGYPLFNNDKLNLTRELPPGKWSRVLTKGSGLEIPKIDYSNEERQHHKAYILYTSVLRDQNDFGKNVD